MTPLHIEEQLREEGFYVTTTVGISMRPMLRDRRDRVVLRPVGDQTLERYDLPLYRCPDGRYLLHRVIGVGEDGKYLIRGDNTYAVEHIPKEWILGVVTEFYRNGKHWSTDDRRYRRYAAVWNAIYPVRFFFHRLRGLAGRIWSRIFSRKNEEK